jgi:hypothetical protein
MKRKIIGAIVPTALLTRQAKAYLKAKGRPSLATKERFSKQYYTVAFGKLEGEPVGTRLELHGIPRTSTYLKVKRDKIHTVEDAILENKR